MEWPVIFKYTHMYTILFHRTVLMHNPTHTKRRHVTFIIEHTEKKVPRMAEMEPVLDFRACLKLPPRPP
jgi:hypothetical protein